MKRISKQKRQQLILAVMVIGMILAGLWFGLIRYQQTSLRAIAERKEIAERKLELVKKTIENADQIEVQLAEAQKQIDAVEANMASGDLYSWAITTIRQFKVPYRVDIPQYSQIDGPKDMALLPKFPYKQATVTIGGTANFHDFGKFVADFENHFPYMRIMNLSLEPLPGLVSSEKEKLTFRMDIVALVKPGMS